MESETGPFEFVIPISYGSTEVFETGRWSFQKPESVLGWAPCEEACPAGNPVPESIHLIEEGQFREALETILLENPFPGTCGRVCYHPCEQECHRKKFDEPVSINDLERFTFDVTLDHDPEFSSFPWRDARRIAIVGAGPCGLSCAYFLSLLGHRVTLFEAEEEPGGILRWGIPQYRLPKDVLRKEVERILSLGVEMKTGTEVGKSFRFEDLKGFDALFVSPGARGSRSLGVKGEESKRVWKGIEFLRKINSGKRIKAGEKVIVIGGGNTAIDVARSARRLGCSVLVAYRRTEEEMPSLPEEVLEAKEEGVRFEFLIQPVEIKETRRGKMRVKFQRLQRVSVIGERRFLSIPVEGGDVTFEADWIFTAIGEEVDLSWLPESLIENKFIKPEAHLWDNRVVLAGGDAIHQPRRVVDAISSGKRAAILMDIHFRGFKKEEVLSRIKKGDKGGLSMASYLRGLKSGQWEEPKKVVPYEDLNPLFFKPKERLKNEILPPEERLKGFLEVHRGFTSEEARISASRCFSCGHCNFCFNCYSFCPEGVVFFDPDGTRRVDLNHCKGCGTCSKVCPRHVIEMRVVL
jgi:NADPH-dependent glutamate synthase beta subunit-like oxidoreductase